MTSMLSSRKYTFIFRASTSYNQTVQILHEVIAQANKGSSIDYTKMAMYGTKLMTKHVYATGYRISELCFIKPIKKDAY